MTMTGFFGGALSSFVRGSAPGLGQFVRGIQTWRGLCLPGYLGPASLDEAVATIDRDLARIRAVGFDRGPDGQLRVVIGHEFSRNGYIRDRVNPVWAFDASNPIPAAWYDALVERLYSGARSWAPGTLISFGTCAIDTGQRDSLGNRILENRGVFVQSAGGDLVHFSKATTASNDFGGFPQGFTMRAGEGPKVFLVRDITGGPPIAVATYVCIDTTLPRVYPLIPQLGTVISAGGPEAPIMGNCQVLYNDAYANDFGFGPRSKKTTVYQPPGQAPELAGALGTVEDSGVTAGGLAAFADLGASLWGKVGAFFDPGPRMTPQPYQRVEVEPGIFVVACDERPIPPLSDDDLEALTSAVCTDGATMLTGGMGQTKIDAYAQALRACGPDIPWDYVQTEISREVSKRVSEALGQMADPFSSAPDELAGTIADDAFRGAIGGRLDELVAEALGASPGFASIAGELGVASATFMGQTALAGPVFDRMTSAAGGASWLSSSVLEAVLTRKVQALEAERGKLQADLASSSTTVTTTQQELTAKQHDLGEVEEQLDHDPDDPDLQSEQQRLQAEVDALAKALADAQAARDGAQEALDDNQQKRDQADQDASSVGRSIEEHAGEVFHGE